MYPIASQSKGILSLLDWTRASSPRKFKSTIKLARGRSEDISKIQLLPCLVVILVLLVCTASQFVQSQLASSGRVSNGVRTMRLAPDRVELPVILPYEGYMVNSSQDLSLSYVIDNKRFVEAVGSRCLSSTIPDDPNSMAPNFILIKPSFETRLNATIPASFIANAGFEPQKRTTFLVHGFTQSYPATVWLRRVRALFEMNSLVSQQNLIIMDWGVASQGSYGQVAARASLMGSFLANFIMKLLELGADPMSIHIVGHSLGAHVSGFAGKRIQPKLARITALDPAGPCFGKIFFNSEKDRLAADDAVEVAVYHYDDSFLGLPGQHGQFDVFVNGGSNQPGCEGNVDAIFQALITIIFRRDRPLSESHTRSTEVATAELADSGCQQVAYQCQDYASFTKGECGFCDEQNTQCFLMGLDYQYRGLAETDRLRTSVKGKIFYITTGSDDLFCLNHFQVLVRFEPNREMKASVRDLWSLELELIDTSQARVEVNVSNRLAPHLFSYLLTSDGHPRPSAIVGANLKVRGPDGKIILPLADSSKSSPIKVLAIEVNFMSNMDPNIRRSLSSRLCPNGLVSGHIGSTMDSSNTITDSSQDDWIKFGPC